MRLQRLGPSRPSSRPAVRTPRPARTLDIMLTLVVIAVLSLLPGQPTTQAAPGWRWYRTDTHVHSSVSADAYADIGIHARAAQDAGYDALFLTDHNGGSSFHINNLTANHMIFEDSYTRWELATWGEPTATANSLATTPVKTGTRSLRLSASAANNKSGEAAIWTKRGPNFRSGSIILKVAIYPTRIDAGSGVYVSVAIGGDPRVNRTPVGYTTAAGTISPGKTTVLVWQLGGARAASSDPNERVLTYPLAYTLNTWNVYTINVSQALADIPAADLPLDYDALTYPKLAVAANGGTASAFFDSFAIDALAPVAPADEYVYRTGVVDDFNSSTFKIFPSYEMGQTGHSQRFNFGITSPAEYVSYSNGTDGILVTQQSGYPAQLNHPGTTTTVEEAIASRGKGADFLEVRDQEWIDAWDAILQQGTQIIGSWSSDTHEGVSTSKAATYIYAPALDFDQLLRSYYEGRVYNARANFLGEVAFNLQAQSREPYPARYPIYVPAGLASIPVHLAISDDLSTSYQVRWIRNGAVIATQSPTGSAYDAVQPIALDGAVTYVRAEIRSSSGSLRAMTQPLFFVDVPELPADKRVEGVGVVTANGRSYNRLYTKGVTAVDWDQATQALMLTLENPASALAAAAVTTTSAPVSVRIDGALVGSSSSFAAWEAASAAAWYYDAGAKRLYLKALHAGLIADVKVSFSSSVDATPPTAPGSVTATAINGQRVDITWTAGSDNVGVAGYIVYRDGAPIVSLGPVSSYTDTSVAPQTTYSYQIQTRDAAGNVSPLSDPAVVTTPAAALFTDGFETGNTSLWNSVTGSLAVQTAERYAGTYGARATSTGAAIWAYKQLDTPRSEVFYRLRFKPVSQGANTVYLLKFRTATGTSQLGLYISSTGRLGYRNDIGARSVTSTTAVAPNIWHTAQVRLRVDPTTPSLGQVEVWLDGARVDALSNTEALGTEAIGRLQIGENAAGRIFDVAFDDVAVDTNPID